MDITPLKIPEVLLIKPDVFKDERGEFVETYNYQRYIEVMKPFTTIGQDNLSVSKKYVVRGMHWQNKPYAQAKLVSVVKGSVFDVAVDVRLYSPTYGKWVSATLTGEGHEQLYIPVGFAHGFQALEDDTIFVYKCTDYYKKEAEASLRWNDPKVNIDWPYFGEAIVSEKDGQAQYLKDIFRK